MFHVKHFFQDCNSFFYHVLLIDYTILWMKIIVMCYGIKNQNLQVNITLKKNTNYIICLHPFYYKDTPIYLLSCKTTKTQKMWNTII